MNVQHISKRKKNNYNFGLNVEGRQPLRGCYYKRRISGLLIFYSS